MLKQQRIACDLARRLKGETSHRSLLAGTISVSGGLALAAILATGAGQASEWAFPLAPDTLIVSSSTYTGTAATVTVGQT